MKKLTLTIACIAFALVAGSQDPTASQDVLDAQFVQGVAEGIASFWKHVALLGVTATGVFYTATHKTK